MKRLTIWLLLAMLIFAGCTSGGDAQKAEATDKPATLSSGGSIQDGGDMPDDPISGGTISDGDE